MAVQTRAIFCCNLPAGHSGHWRHQRAALGRAELIIRLGRRNIDLTSADAGSADSVDRVRWSPRATALAVRIVLPLLAAAIALTFDSLDRTTPFSVWKSGLLDEPSHFAMAALCVLALQRFIPLSRAFVIAALIASVAIDLDHIPIYLGAGWVSPVPGGRPYTHSVATLMVLLVICLATKRGRPAAAGAFFGVVVHLIRDICEGPPGVPLYWPFSEHIVISGQRMFWAFIGLTLVLAVIPLPTWTRRRRVATSFAGERADPPL